MPVTITPASHQPKLHPSIHSAESLDELLHLSCPDSYLPDETRIVASSFYIQNTAGSRRVYPSSSSFVRSAIEAWGRHSHLVLRPEDIWFTILVQINFYMHRKAESLRPLFVSHPGKKRLEVTNNWQEIVDQFRDELQCNLKAPWMSDWITPGFSTSTIEDERTATVLMMGMMKAYFDYAGGEICGIPSITLLGTKQDWRRLLDKLDRLGDFGLEPEHYARRLRSILSRIVRSFDNPTTAETNDFWDQMVQAKVKHSKLCVVPPTQYTVSGWILGLFYWHSTGRVNRRFAEGWSRMAEPGTLEYDNVRYGETPLEDIPIGYAKAPFEMLQDSGEYYRGWILAGSIGKSIVDEAPEGYTAACASSDSNRERFQMAKVEDDKSDRFSSLLRFLNCFSGKQSKDMHASAARENLTKEVSEKHHNDDGHTTIQPMSGWFLFGPQKDVGPFVDTEEVYGPTVDAVESCEGAEHYHCDQFYPS